MLAFALAAAALLPQRASAVAALPSGCTVLKLPAGATASTDEERYEPHAPTAA